MPTIAPIELVGYVATLCTSLSFLPQFARTWRTKSAGDLSVGMFVVYLIGIALWLAYGLSIQNAPIIVGNVIALLIVGLNFALLLHFRRTPRVA